jgi:peptide chain release factor 2
MEAEQLNIISNTLSDLLTREQALRGYLLLRSKVTPPY